MAIDTVNVGSNQRTVVTIGDSSVASQYEAVLPVQDATNTSGKNAGLTLAVPMLKDPGGNLDIARSMPGSTGIQSVSVEGVRTCFSVGLSLTPAATPTDIFTIYGSGTKTVRIIRIVISGLATTAGSNDILLINRSTANTGGTSTNPTPVPHDTNGTPSATATLTAYTANPTLGTGIGTVRQRKLNLGLAGAAGLIEFDFGDKNDQMFVLRGTTQGLCINLNSISLPTGGGLDIEIEFCEDNS